MKKGIIIILATFLVFGNNLTGMAQEKEDKKTREEQKQEQIKREQEQVLRQQEQKKREQEQKKQEQLRKVEKEKALKEMEIRKEFLEQEMQEAMKEKEFAVQEFAIHLDDLRDQIADVEVLFEDGAIHIPEHLERGVYVMGDEWYPFNQGSQTQLTLRNSFRGGSDSSSGTFEVDEGTKRFKCMISGKVRSGEIKITIKYPGGKIFKDMTINSSAEVTFSQSLNIGDADPDKYIGSWEYSIEAVKAEGNYLISISTN